jgi:hypothetical protein
MRVDSYFAGTAAGRKSSLLSFKEFASGSNVDQLLSAASQVFQSDSHWRVSPPRFSPTPNVFATVPLLGACTSQASSITRPLPSATFFNLQQSRTCPQHNQSPNATGTHNSQHPEAGTSAANCSYISAATSTAALATTAADAVSPHPLLHRKQHSLLCTSSGCDTPLSLHHVPLRLVPCKQVMTPPANQCHTAAAAAALSETGIQKADTLPSSLQRFDTPIATTSAKGETQESHVHIHTIAMMRLSPHPTVLRHPWARHCSGVTTLPKS